MDTLETYRKIRSEFGRLAIVEETNPAAIQSAKVKLSCYLEPGEVPLFAGYRYDLLVSNRCIHTANRVIRLESVYLVARSQIDFLAALGNHGVAMIDLVVNGRSAATAAALVMPLRFLTRVLEALGEARRRELGPDSRFSRLTQSEAALVCGIGIRTKLDHNELERRLIEAGVASNEAAAMVTFMAERKKQPQRMKSFLFVGGGLGMIGSAQLLVDWMKAAGSPLLLVPTGFVIAGVYFCLRGAYIAVTGDTGLDESQLADIWISTTPQDESE